MIYVSTSCLKNPRNVLRVLSEYDRANIENVELGSVHSYFDINELKKFSCNFLMHNYFPPPKKSFNFNLASQNESIRKQSILLAKNALDLCRKLDIPLYTFHAGFTIDPRKLGIKFNYSQIPTRSKSIITYILSLTEIIDFSQSCGVKIAMEPNVVQQFNLVENKNKLLLFANFDEIELLYKFFNKNEIGILLDLGHTSVTSHWLGFNKDNFITKLKNKIIAIHISNNNGLQDQHKSLTTTCWQIKKLKLFKKIPIILESMNLTINEINSNLELLKKVTN